MMKKESTRKRNIYHTNHHVDVILNFFNRDLLPINSIIYANSHINIVHKEYITDNFKNCLFLILVIRTTLRSVTLL